MTDRTDWNASSYDAISSPQASWGAVVLERLLLNGDERVLDAGCGSGRVTEELLHRLPSGHVVALDQSPTMLASARERLAPFGDNVTFVECDLLDDALELIGPVDAVFSNATFHWVTNHDRLFQNLAKVIAPGGQLVAQCGAEHNIDNLIETVRKLGHERAGMWEYASAEVTAERLHNAGFVDIKTWTNLEPTRFDSLEQLSEFLETVCLRAHLDTLAPNERRPFLAAVAAALPDQTLDYVRLNIVARRP